MRLGLYVIIDPYNIGNKNFNDLCIELIESKIDTIQLRNKFGNKKEYIEQSLFLKNLCEKTIRYLLLMTESKKL